ncbi:Spy/CpxP family protein refolding chaperone [Brytella acorum]|uniref:Periplasmic heavy metal sensor n=1 Tax=Brytella acorum TaxID=2959299 RepID=A0AA35UP11_9PROT|nr:periplasmic heavy metal sensor [Brytella acorum]MDF3624626.1 periplasmic heavy metal sensor [Brytella acorum]CAI9120982.1 periplasmic heavy metal sensor [Brytella acorum]
MSKITIFASVLMGVAAATASAGAMPPSHGPGPHGPMMGCMGMLLPGVELTDSQKKELRALRKGKHDDWRADREKMRGLDSQIEDILLADGSVDRARLATLTDEKRKMTQAAEEARLDDAIRLHDLLTPDQRALARANRAKLDGLESQIQTILHAPKNDASGPDDGRGK